MTLEGRETLGKSLSVKNTVNCHRPSTVVATIEAEPVAGPSNVTVAEGVVFLPPPSDKPLVNELRQMVAGLNHLSEGKKA